MLRMPTSSAPIMARCTFTGWGMVHTSGTHVNAQVQEHLSMKRHAACPHQYGM